MQTPLTTEFLNSIRAGDQRALGDVLNSLRPYVRLIVRSLLREYPARVVDESDLIQESLLQASRCSQSFHGQSQAEWLGWLRTITVRTARRMLISEERQPGNVPSGSEPGTLIADGQSAPGNRLIQQETADRMALALAQLPEDMQQVLLSRVVDNLGYEEISHLMGRSPGAMRVLYLRALRRLKDAWQTDSSSGFGVPQ